MSLVVKEIQANDDAVEHTDGWHSASFFGFYSLFKTRSVPIPLGKGVIPRDGLSVHTLKLYSARTDNWFHSETLAFH